MTIFAENGVEISDGAAQEYFAFCEKASATKELDLDRLDDIAGGLTEEDFYRRMLRENIERSKRINEQRRR